MLADGTKPLKQSVGTNRFGIHVRAVSLEILKIPNLDRSMNIISLALNLHLAGAMCYDNTLLHTTFECKCHSLMFMIELFLHEFCMNLDVSSLIASYVAKIWLCLSWVEWPFSNRRYHYIPEIGKIRLWGYILTWDDYKKWSLSELHVKASLFPLQYIVCCLIVRSREVSKPRYFSFKLSHRFRIRQALRQYCCRTACQI